MWWRGPASSTPSPAITTRSFAVHLSSRSVAWSVGYIQQHAARHGFVPGMVPGRLVLPGAEGAAHCRC